jgi:glycine betaine/choline ABC-type transport system substrate-binding protein
MSRAFVKEGESDQLKDVAPNMASLLFFLKRENGAAVHELKTRYSETFGREVHDMSDGLTYGLNDDHQWEVYLD